jgi:transposase
LTPKEHTNANRSNRVRASLEKSDLSRQRNRTSKAAHSEIEADAVWAKLGEAGAAYRPTGAAARRSGNESSQSADVIGFGIDSGGVEAGASAAAGGVTARNCDATAKRGRSPDCGGTLDRLGEDVSETLEYVPARFKVIRTVRPKLSCRRCDRIVQEPAPHRPIARGLAGPGLLAHVLRSKYADHLPLYRQSEIYEREGVELDRSTLADWVGGASRTLEPLVDALRQYVLEAKKLHGDDIPVPVLAPGNGKTKTGRLWTYVRDDRPAGSAEAPAVWFAYSPDRKSEHPANHLANFKGTVQADAFAGFNRLYEKGVITEAACWAHVRRKFHDLYEAHASPIVRIPEVARVYLVPPRLPLMRALLLAVVVPIFPIALRVLP